MTRDANESEEVEGVKEAKNARRGTAVRILKRFVGGIVLAGICIGLDVFLHKTGIVERGAMHPHGFGTLRQLLGWFAAWVIGWGLMRWYISFRGRRIGPKEYGNFGRAGVWTVWALLVLLALPIED